MVKEKIFEVSCRELNSTNENIVRFELIVLPDAIRALEQTLEKYFSHAAVTICEHFLVFDWSG